MSRELGNTFAQIVRGGQSACWAVCALQKTKGRQYIYKYIFSDGVLEIAVSAQGSLETSFLMSWLKLRHFYKRVVSGPFCLDLGSVSTQYKHKPVEIVCSISV